MPSDEELIPLADEDIEWEILDTSEFTIKNLKHTKYWVYINTNRASDMQYSAIFEEITDDHRDLHTVYFYFSKPDVIDSEDADIVMRQVAEDITPLPKKT